MHDGNILRAIEKNTRLQEKISLPILLQGSPTEDGRLIHNLSRSIDLQGMTEVALINGTLWKTWKNIGTNYLNNHFRFKKIGKSKATETLTIPDGLYNLRNETGVEGIADIRSTVQELMSSVGYEERNSDGSVAFPIEIIPNYSIGRVQITLYPGYVVEWQGEGTRSGNFAVMLGFEPGTALDNSRGATSTKTFTGTSTPHIERVNSILIHTNLVSSSLYNGTQSDIIYTVPPAALPGSMIQVQPFSPVYTACGVSPISYIQVRFTDELNRPIDFGGENITVLLHLRTV